MDHGTRTDGARQARRSTLTAADGFTLAVFDWPAAPVALGTDAAPRRPTRGTLLIVHGLGEHAARYAPLAARLNALGWSVRAYDQYGHGESVRLGAGRPGALARDLQLPEHLTAVSGATSVACADEAQAAGHAPGPLIVLGHSLGGLVAASAVARGLLRPDGLVLSSPALAVDMAGWQRVAVGWLPRLAPGLTLGNGLEPGHLSHDPAVVAAYEADPLVHDRICARLGAFVAREGEQVRAAAPRWSVPTLLLYAGDDRLVSPTGSRAFAMAAKATGAPVESRCFGTLYHEIFNEPDPADPGESPFTALATWLDARG
jgi:alpha-beta hydrolase superfamily lysophospholipase